MKLKLTLLTILVFLLAIQLAQAEQCGDGYCTENETAATCCVDCGCTGNQTCYGAPGAADYQKTCIDRCCGDDFCDDTLDENSIPEEYWKNCCDDCGCHGSDKWEKEKMANYTIPYYRATPDDCYDNRCDGCNIDKSCDDGDNCTIDDCVLNAYLNKTICLAIPITECVHNDTCCPANCNYQNDNDCKGNCGDFKCEMPEDCENCLKDCGCDRGFDCVNKICQRSKSYCEVRGKVESGNFCNGKNWVAQFSAGAYCEQDYQCLGLVCEKSVCLEEKAIRIEKEHLVKAGIAIIILAGIAVYLIIIIQRYWNRRI